MPPLDLSPGSIFAGYRIEGIAGQGGMGVVYRATQLGLDRPVALKLISSELAEDINFRERFKRESQLAAAIDHPNVIPVYEAGEAEGRLFIAMRYVDGTDLSAQLAREGRLEPPDGVNVVGQIAAALDAAHARGLVHRDIKPANVLIAGSQHVYLTDFGLTKHATSASGLTKTGQFVGTLDYVPPEQIEGKRADARADVYALGCVLFHVVSGRRPYERDSDVAKMYAHLKDPPPTITDVALSVPTGLNGVIRRAMAKDPDERYPSAGDLARAALAALDEKVAQAPERSVATGLAAPTAAAAAPTAPLPGDPTVPAGPSPGAEPTAPAGAPAEPTPVAPVSPVGETRAAEAAEAPAAPAAPPAPAAPRPAPPARRRGLAVSVASLLLLAAVAVVAVATGVLGGGEDGGGDAGGGTAGATIPVGNGPDGIVVFGGEVWVSNFEDGTITRIDAASSKASGQELSVGRNPDGIAVDESAVWAANTDDDAVSRVEVGGAGGASSIDVGAAPVGLALARVNVWVANSGDDTVTRISRESQAPIGPPIPVGAKPLGVAIGTENVWVTNADDGTVSPIPRRINEAAEPIEVGAQPRGVVESEGTVWVVNEGDDTVTRIDASSGRVTGQPIAVGSGPREVAAGEGFVWVTNTGENTVTRIDPGSGEVVGEPIPVGDQPQGVAVGEGAVWVANADDGTVTRIDP